MTTTHIRIAPGQCPRRVVTCGAPERAAVIAEQLEQSAPLARNREYHSYVGLHRGEQVLVISHGIGAAGAAICWNELIDLGAGVILRVGTAGGLYEGAGIGDLVIPTAAIRRDGLTHRMLPAEFPAVADFDLTARLLSALSGRGGIARSGIILSTDLFYPGLLEPEQPFFARANAIAVEMECSALFVLGALRRVSTAAVLILDGNPLTGLYDPTHPRMVDATRVALLAALDAIVTVALPSAL